MRIDKQWIHATTWVSYGAKNCRLDPVPKLQAPFAQRLERHHRSRDRFAQHKRTREECAAGRFTGLVRAGRGRHGGRH